MNWQDILSGNEISQ